MLEVALIISAATAVFCAAGWWRERIASLTLSCFIMKYFREPKDTEMDECRNIVAKDMVYNNAVMKFFEKR